MTDTMSNSTINTLYECAKKWGALGGKIMGAGGGGFYLFYVPEISQENFRLKMQNEGYEELSWQFDFDGCSSIYSI
jgi:D-glycero-alpha-D-manno-heptose-7-phosphate kinase